MYVIVHYVGDWSIFEPFINGNSKVIRRTCSSVCDVLKNDATSATNSIENELKSKADTGADLDIKSAKTVSSYKSFV